MALFSCRSQDVDRDLLSRIWYGYHAGSRSTFTPRREECVSFYSTTFFTKDFWGLAITDGH
jgi:hypothetical protein